MSSANIRSSGLASDSSSSSLDFQVFFAAVGETKIKGAAYYANKAERLRQKRRDEMRESGGNIGSDSFFSSSEAAAKIYSSPSRCTVLLTGRTMDGGVRVLARVKGFRPWFYVIDMDSGPLDSSGASSSDDRTEELRRVLKRSNKLTRWTSSSKPSSRKRDALQFRIVRERRKLTDGCYPNPLDGGATIRQFTVYKISCASTQARFLAVDVIANYIERIGGEASGGGLVLAEHTYDFKPLMQFYTQTGLHPMAWARVNTDLVRKKYTSPQTRLLALAPSERSLEIKVDLDAATDIVTNSAAAAAPSLEYVRDKQEMAPMRVVVMDIECYSSDGSFPDPSKPDNQVIIIGTREYLYNTTSESKKDISRGIQFVLGTTEGTSPEFEIRNYSTEADLLRGYRDYIVHEADADLIMTWNGSRFDDRYLWVRGGRGKGGGYQQQHQQQQQVNIFSKMSVLSTCPMELEEVKTSSKQSGDKAAYEWKGVFFGRLPIDLMMVVMKEATPYRSYSLEYVSSQLFGGHKVDLTPGQLFRNFKAGPAERFENAVYCNKDCELPYLIDQRNQSFMSICQMAATTYTELFDILYRGQTRKIFNLLSYYAAANGRVLNRIEDVWQPSGYEGASVLEPAIGYHKEPVPVLDFASLYPSIMTEHNLCYSTQLLRGPFFSAAAAAPEDDAAQEQQQQQQQQRRHHIDGGTDTDLLECAKRLYPNMKIDIPEIECSDGSILRPVFYQNERGLIPEVLQTLLKKRKEMKFHMEAAESEGNAVKYAVFNGRQLALKVSANSIYGFTGAPLSQMPRLVIAASVTCYGRVGLAKTRNLVETKYTAEYCYKEVLGYSEVPAEVLRYYGGSSSSSSCDAAADIKTVVLGGDTDSIFPRFPVLPTVEGLRESIVLAKAAADDCTKTLFAAPMKLEFEKAFFPMLVEKKKRYAACRYMTGHERPQDIPVEEETKWRKFILSRGLETVRRDVPPFTSRLMMHVLYYILIQRDPEAAYAHLEAELGRLLDRKVSYDEMMITSKLKHEDSYATPENLAHVQVVRKQRAAAPGSEPQPGDRVEFVYVVRTPEETRKLQAARGQKPSEELKAADRAEALSIARGSDLPLDVIYYYNHKIRICVEKIFEEIDGARAERLFNAWRDRIAIRGKIAANGKPLQMGNVMAMLLQQAQGGGGSSNIGTPTSSTTSLKRLLPPPSASSSLFAAAAASAGGTVAPAKKKAKKTYAPCGSGGGTLPAYFFTSSSAASAAAKKTPPQKK